jgi:hypothetical protein
VKCCECGKEVDVTVNVIPPSWYGAYHGIKMVAMICAECIAIPEKLERWRNAKLDKED